MENQVTTRGVGIQYGVIAGVVMIIYSVILQISDLAFETWAGNISYVFLAVLIYLAHKKFLATGDGFMSFGQGLGIGFWVSLVGGVISSVFSFIYFTFIDTSFTEQLVEKTRFGMEEQGMSDTDIDAAMSITEMFLTPGALAIFGVVFIIIGGFIISLISSAINKKADPKLEV